MGDQELEQLKQAVAKLTSKLNACEQVLQNLRDEQDSLGDYLDGIGKARRVGGVGEARAGQSNGVEPSSDLDEVSDAVAALGSSRGVIVIKQLYLRCEIGVVKGDRGVDE